MLKQTAVATLIVSTLSGCQLMKLAGPDQVCTPDTRVNIPVADVKTKSSDDLRVIILPVDMDYDDEAKSKLTNVIRNDLESQISKSGADLVDRKLANKLKEEIKLAEQSGRYNTKGVPIADLAVITEVVSSDFSKTYYEADSYVNDDGETVYIPPKCRYEVEVKAISKVVSLPGMELVKRMELTGDDSVTTETRSSNCNFSRTEYTSLASKAAAESVSYNAELKKMLAPSAQVLELRQCDAGTMVKIAMGTNKRIIPGADVTFAKHMKVDDEIETFGYGEGYVVDIPEHGIKSKYSWVAIDEDMALKVQKGDQVKIVPKKCEGGWMDLECQMNKLQNDMGL